MDTPSDRLKKARAKAGFRTASAAIARFGWTATTYRSHENGQTVPPLDDAIAYAAAYKTTPQWLLLAVGGPDDPGIDQMLRDKPADVKRRARRMIEAMLEE